MKNFILTIIVVFLIGFDACNKDEEFCWECTTIRVETMQDGTKDTSLMDIRTHCGFTEDGIKMFEYETYPVPNVAHIQTCEKE